MRAVGGGVLIVGFTQLHRGEVVGVGPSALSRDHLPPHAHVLDGVNPRDILQNARIVKVENQARGKDIRRRGANHHRTPRRDTRGLDAAFVTRGVRTKEGTKYHILVVEVEMHGGEVERGGLMDVEVKAIVGLHLKGGLHAGGRECRPRPPTVFVAPIP